MTHKMSKMSGKREK